MSSSQRQKLSEFDIICKLGQGSFSIVYKVKRLCDGSFYAMKQVKLNMLKDKEKQNALNEVRILASLNQRYVIGYKEAFIEEESNTLCIIMEYAENGDIHQQVEKKIKNQSQFTEQDVWKALVHMTSGLKTLHENNILHRDLKCANVFQTKEGTYKLGDLNVSKIAQRGLVYTQTGTPYYASPEVWRDEPYDAKSDIWSLGCVVYEMCALRPPFTASNMAALYSKIQKGVFPHIPNRFSYGMQQVVAQLLRLNSSTRPSCEQILNSPHVLSNAASHLEHHHVAQPTSQLLRTIYMPKNGKMKELSDQLPKQKYEQKKEKKTHDILEKDKSKNLLDDMLRNRSYLANRSQVSLLPHHKDRSFVKAGSSRPPLSKVINLSQMQLDEAENIRQLRINSVQEETPRVPVKVVIRRPTSQYIQNCYNQIKEDKSAYIEMKSSEPKSDEVYAILNQIILKERRLIQPLHKQLSDLTPLKDLLNNKSYLNELPKLLQDETSYRKYDRKSSPYLAPKVAISKSSPFNVVRGNKENLKPKHANLSYLQNDYYIFE